MKRRDAVYADVMNTNIPAIDVLPVLDDNFSYVIRWGGGVAVVDPAEAKPVRKHLEKSGARLTYILITHDHGDHIGGVAELKKVFGAEIIAPQGARVPDVDRAVKGGDRLDLGGLNVSVIATPGHCAAHVSFYLPDAAAVFSGDCLFGGGCGRLFGNPPEIMFASLRRLAELPDETKVYFGHEYTASNLRFAMTIEPENADLKNRIAAIRADVPTTPGTIALEKATNPFLRARSVSEFAERRRLKDAF